MQVEFLPNLLEIHFQQGSIRTLLYDTHGFLTAIDQQHQIVAYFKTVASPAYNAQYGTPLSTDQQFVFIGNWEKGLYCYSLLERQLIWKVGPGRVRQIIVTDKNLVVEMAGRGIYQRDGQTGELLQVVKMSAIDTFRPLGSHELFAGPSRGKYTVFDLPTLAPKKTVRQGDLFRLYDQ